MESLLIWIILRKMSIPGAFLAALIFAVHPVNVESVAWIAQRKGMLAMLFFLLSILWYLKMDQQSWPRQYRFYAPGAGRWYWLSLLAFVLAMFSKGSVAVLPVLLLGIVWWRRTGTVSIRRRPMGWSPSVLGRDLLRAAPFFLAAVILAAMNVWFQSPLPGEIIRLAGFTERLLGAGGVIWFYLYKALLPLNLAFVYPQWHIRADNLLCWLPLMTAAVVTAVLWLYRKGWSRPFLFAWGFFCVALVPVMGFTDVGFMFYSLVTDHYQHIALIGVITLAAAGWSIWHAWTRGVVHWAATIMAVLAVGALALLTWRQSGLFRDPTTLYRASMEKYPNCALPYNLLGEQLIHANQPEQMIKYYRRALQLNPIYPQAHNNLGNALLNLDQPEEAIKHFREALRLSPRYFEVYNSLGVALDKIGQKQEAIECYNQVLQMKPDFADARNNLGVALSDVGQAEEAIKQYQQALSIKPDFAQAHNNLGLALADAGRTGEAIEQFQQALRIKSDFAQAHNGLGNALAKLRQLPEAIHSYEQALDLKADYYQAHYNLGNALYKTGRLDEAIAHYLQAIRFKPDYCLAYANLAAAYADANRSAEAIAAAQKALDLARSQGQTAQAKQIEEWLNTFRAGLPHSESNSSQ